MCAAGKFSEDAFGDVFLVVDGWGTFKQEFEALETSLHPVLLRMLKYGVHLIVATNRWAELHSGVRDQLGTRLELRLGDPLDSTIDIRTARDVAELPGPGLTTGKLHFLAALPRLDAATPSAISRWVLPRWCRPSTTTGTARERHGYGCCQMCCRPASCPRPPASSRWRSAGTKPTWPRSGTTSPPFLT